MSLVPLSRGLLRHNVLPLYRESFPWLLDTCLDCLNKAHQKAQLVFAPIMVESILSLLGQKSAALLDFFIADKAHVTLVLICTLMVKYMWAVVSAKENTEQSRVLCMALVHITEICIHHTDISRLVRSHLVESIEEHFGPGHMDRGINSDLDVRNVLP